MTNTKTETRTVEDKVILNFWVSVNIAKLYTGFFRRIPGGTILSSHTRAKFCARDRCILLILGVELSLSYF